MSEMSNSRSEIVDGVEYRYSSDWVHKLESEEHWRSYWQQLKLALPELEEGDTILEIGPGSGFVTNYLRSKGYKVTTLDIDDHLFLSWPGETETDCGIGDQRKCRIGEMAYDRERGFLYVLERFADEGKPVVCMVRRPKRLPEGEKTSFQKLVDAFGPERVRTIAAAIVRKRSVVWVRIR